MNRHFSRHKNYIQAFLRLKIEIQVSFQEIFLFQLKFKCSSKNSRPTESFKSIFCTCLISGVVFFFLILTIEKKIEGENESIERAITNLTQI